MCLWRTFLTEHNVSSKITPRQYMQFMICHYLDDCLLILFAVNPTCQIWSAGICLRCTMRLKLLTN